MRIGLMSIDFVYNIINLKASLKGQVLGCFAHSFHVSFPRVSLPVKPIDATPELFLYIFLSPSRFIQVPPLIYPFECW